jgi:hypothetical protein
LRRRRPGRGPLRTKAFGAAFCLLALSCASHAAAPETRALLGVTLDGRVASLIGEIRDKLGKDVDVAFAELDEEGAGGDYTLGVSYLTGAGVPVVRVDESFRNRTREEKLAVLAHELLHLRLRVRGYPLFLFSPGVMTLKGPAQDVEQPNVNDLVSLIEHRIFAAQMRAADFDQIIDLTNAVEGARARRGVEDSQAETLNYARALLEWDNPARLEELTRVHRANGWRRSLADGRRLAEIISSASASTPAEVTPVFLRCMSVLYRAEFRVEADRGFAHSKIYPQMLIHARRPPRGVRPRRGR